MSWQRQLFSVPPTKTVILVTLGIILMIGGWLRLSQFGELTRFNADQVRDAQVIDAMHSGDWPLLGPKAGGTQFNLGPAYYYLSFLSSLLFGQDPAGIALIVALLSLLSIPILFFLLRFLFSPWGALSLTLLYAFSFFSIRYARFGWNPNLIPFFLLSYLLVLRMLLTPHLRRPYLTSVLLGILLGIGTQLHVIMLVIMPVLLGAALLFRYFRISREIPWRQLIVTFVLFLLTLSPLLAYDIINNGENMRSFLSGYEEKTSATESISGRVTAPLQFFLQGTTYALSGLEPYKNWLRPWRIIASGNLRELALFVGGIAFTVLGGFLFIRRLKSFTKDSLDPLWYLIGVNVVTFFILLLFLGEEVNIRFYIALPFLPYIFMGLLSEWWIDRPAISHRVKLSVIALTLSVLCLSNGFAFHQVYTLDNEDRAQAYGGISLGEATEIVRFLKAALPEEARGTAVFLHPFQYERSLLYLASKADVSLENFDERAKEPGAFSILVTTPLKKEADMAAIAPFYTLLSERNYKRYTSILLKKKELEKIRVGFITDIHAYRSSKATPPGNIIDRSSRGLEAFVSRMNTSFQPHIVVEGGDLIDGTNRRGQKSIDDFQVTEQYMDRLTMPHHHVVGNHDMRGLSKSEWQQLAHTDSSYFFIDTGDVRSIILDHNDLSNERDKEDNPDESEISGYSLSNDQFVWLEDTLKNSQHMRVVVFIHVPLADFDAPVFQIGRGIRLEHATRLRDLFQKYGVLAVLSGHVERLRFFNDDSTRHFILPGLWKSQRKDILWLDCYYEVTVGQEVSVKMYYRKDPLKPYQEITLPSSQYDALVK